MEIKICIGSACYVKGSHEIISVLQKLIAKYRLEEKLILKASFCLGNCTEAVSVMLDDQLYSVTPEHIESFFYREILEQI